MFGTWKCVWMILILEFMPGPSSSSPPMSYMKIMTKNSIKIATAMPIVILPDPKHSLHAHALHEHPRLGHDWPRQAHTLMFF